MQGQSSPIKRKAFDGDIFQACKLKQSSIVEILGEPKSKIKSRQIDNVASDDSRDPKPKKITPDAAGQKKTG